MAGARRYARALLDVALAQGTAAQVREQLRDAVALLEGHADLEAILSHPAVGPERKKKVVEAVWGGKGELLVRLLRLLVDRGRVALLPAIEEAFVALWNAKRGVVSAEAVSAVSLDEAQKAALAQAIRQLTGMEAEIRTEVDPSLLGGLRVRMGGRVYDGSVRAQLKALRARLGEGAPS